jgi:hypothetical protein
LDKDCRSSKGLRRQRPPHEGVEVWGRNALEHAGALFTTYKKIKRKRQAQIFGIDTKSVIKLTIKVI